MFTFNFEKLECKSPNYFFTKKDFSNENIYDNGISLKDIFSNFSVGIQTSKDKIAIDYTGEKLLNKLKEFAYSEEEYVRNNYSLGEDSVFWKLLEVQKFLKSTNIDPNYVKKISYRPFDSRFIYYSKDKGVVVEPRYKVMKYILEIENNISLVTTRFLSTNNFFHAFVTSKISDKCFVSNRGSESSYVFPLYIKEDQFVFKDIIKENFKIPFREFINTKYNKKLKAEEILGYIYSVLYSNFYRTKFYEVLKIDFPKIIFADDTEVFLKLSELGRNLINAHLLKDNLEFNQSIGKHVIDQNQNQNKAIEKILYDKETKELYYNSTSKFTNISIEVYEYVIGSYQVIKSYLKYRKGRELGLNEIEHLEDVIKTLNYTIIVQKEIDNIMQKLKEFNE
ncbi:type ISP restriction/modification enzyme [Borreliella carolinensis]|uniref:Type ISP restriction/modification enzyme n=1 Tax=Borreliella carolinensis TaxID=478174 RepID=A0ACD5GLQ7_9SPIR